MAATFILGPVAVALGLGALLIAKGFILGALIGSAARNNNNNGYSG